MDKPAKNAIRDLVLSLRKTLEGEIERELGRYGIYADRAWIDASTLPRLSAEERDKDRPRIEAAIRREQDAGLSRADAIRAFIRETAYTHMNRLLGLKCMDVRELIEETVTTRPIYSDRSKRHRDYLDEHPQAHRAPDRGLVAMLQQVYAEVSQQIGVVFDLDSDYSVVWLRHTVLKECMDWINALDAEVARKQGQDPETMPSVYADDTVLGWVYQYFQEEEKARIDHAINQNTRMGGYDIIPRTQLYTDEYIVRFLVQNSLGALWMEMHPDSDLCKRWDYFIEDPNLQNEDGTRKQGREPRPVAELTLLDPACGSGHFLLYAFDLFAQMYEAEARMQGQPMDRAGIARRILRNNLYGIDIDLRSIQLSALNLCMKACTYAGVRLDELQDGGSVQVNLVCADIVLRRGPELKELLDRFKTDPLTQDLIRTIWHGLENARELGSLLRIEEQVDVVIARKRKAEKGSFWEHPQEAWELWKQDFLNTLKASVNRAAESFDVNRRMFGQEAIKGVQFLDLMMRRYDVVATNPPYMGTRNVTDEFSSQIKALYPRASADLYAAFIQKCCEVSAQNGFVAMIAQQSFLFLPTYKKLRAFLLKEFEVRVLAHLGPHAFSEISGEKVNAAMFSFSRTRDHGYGVYLKLVDCGGCEEKANMLSRLASDLASSPDNVYVIEQSLFRAIAGSPMCYWIDLEVLQAFETLPPLDQVAIIRQGIGTDKYTSQHLMFYTWELLPKQLGTRYKYFGTCYGDKWYGLKLQYLDWSEEAVEYLSTHGNRLPSRHLYFRQGLVCNPVSSSGFRVRLLEENSVFGKGPAIFAENGLLYYLLGSLNSYVCEVFLEVINPTVNYQTGDVKRIPFAQPDTSASSEVTRLAHYCVSLQKEATALDILSESFSLSAIEQAILPNGRKDTIRDIYLEGLSRMELRDAARLCAEAAIEAQVLDVYGFDRDMVGTLAGWQSVLLDDRTATIDLPTETCQFVDALPHVTLDEWASAFSVFHTGLPDLPPRNLLELELTRLYIDNDLTLGGICVALNLNPISVVTLRRRLGLVNHADLKHEVENLLTHRIWELGKRDEDGIIPYDTGLRNRPLLEQVRGEIETVFGTEQAVDIETEMDEILGRGGLARWLGDPFFKKHKSQFKRRPILWQIISPDKQFRVLLYYHKLDHDTLPKIRSQHLWPLLERARTQRRAAQEQHPPDLKTIGDLEEYIADLEECDRRLESVIQGAVEVDLPEWANGPYRGGKPPYHPHLDDGVKVNILPLQAARLLPMKKVV